MAQPLITYSLDWGNNPLPGTLSGKTYTNPSGTFVDCNTLGVTFSSSTDYKKFYATSVKEGNDYGFINDVLVDIRETNPTGVLIQEYNNRKADVELSFNILATSHLMQGDGTYRIGLYIQDNDGYWNYEYFFIVTEGGNFILSDNSNLQVTVQTD